MRDVDRPPVARATERHALLAMLTFVVAVAALVPSARRLPQNPDEGNYAWSGTYFLRKLVRLDLRPDGTDRFVDPGLSPRSLWALSMPMVGRLVYGVALAVTGAEPPARPHLWGIDREQRADARLDPRALAVVRGTSVLCAALGLGCFAWRLGWVGLGAALAFLSLGHVRDDLAVAFTEGPLILTFGLVALAWGRRVLSLACALSASVKLTGVALWPLLLSKRARGGASLARSLAATLLAWTVLMPPSWFWGGPAYLGIMFAYRRVENTAQSAAMHGDSGIAWDSLSPDVYLPSRYLLPFELALALLAAEAVRRARWTALMPVAWRLSSHDDAPSRTTDPA